MGRSAKVYTSRTSSSVSAGNTRSSLMGTSRFSILALTAPPATINRSEAWSFTALSK